MQTTLSILGLVIAVAVVAMAILNFSAWVILRRFPDLLLNENFRNHKKHMARFRGDLKPFVNEWFDLQEGDWDAFEKECTKFQRYGFEHEAFTEFRHRPVQGRFYNISEDGYRLIKNQGPWPIEPKNYNIFLFGGSTAINLGRDETAIPSYLQEVIRERGYDNACVYNFGRGAYFSTQERLLIDKLLAEDIRPDLVIFFDGLNDCIFCDGVPATFGWLSMVWEEFHRKSWGKVDNETLATPQWSLLGEFTSSLPLPQLIGALASRGKSGEVTNESLFSENWEMDEDRVDNAISQYMHNKEGIELLTQQKGIQTLFVWQPSPAYEYDLKYHTARMTHFGLGEHARSGKVYAKLDQIRKNGGLGANFLWMGDFQKGRTEPIYLDSVHYTAKFNQEIAAEIADCLLENNYLDHR